MLIKGRKMSRIVTLEREQVENLLEINYQLLERCRELQQEVKDSKQLLREIRKTYFEILELEAKKDLGTILTVASRRIGDQRETSRPIHPSALKPRSEADSEDTVKLCKQSLKIKERLGDWMGIGTTIYKLAIIEQRRGNYDAAEKYYEQSLELDRELKNQERMETTLQRLAVIRQEKETRSEKEELCNRSREITQRQPDQREEFAMLRELLIQARIH